tara:strand:- start:248 stop:508 length:261 start_codon:yes stop_codon:yes gene_type:complete
MDNDLEKQYQRMNEDFDYLLERYRKMSELLDHYQKYLNFTHCNDYFFDEETLSHIFLEYLDSNIDFCFRKRRSHINQLKDLHKKKE